MAEMRVAVMLSMMRALWEVVTPDLRGVAVSWTGSPAQGTVEARFLFEGPIGEVQQECVSLAETSCMAEFLPGVEVVFRGIASAERELLPNENWVFLRWEP